jgi:hypothetical protein
MITVALGILVFALSAVREGLGVFWVHYAERSDGHRTGVVAMIQAVAEIVGVGLSIHSLPYALAYVLGHYFGVRISILYKLRVVKIQADDPPDRGNC